MRLVRLQYEYQHNCGFLKSVELTVAGRESSVMSSVFSQGPVHHLCEARPIDLRNQIHTHQLYSLACCCSRVGRALIYPPNFSVDYYWVPPLQSKLVGLPERKISWMSTEPGEQDRAERNLSPAQ